MTRRRTVLHQAALAPALLLAPHVPSAQPSPPETTAAEGPVQRLYAIEIRTGPNWVASKPPQEQAHFREHSAHLKALRDQGRLTMGARYGEIGLVVVGAESEAAARALMEPDPSMQAGTFTCQVHLFSVFYGGCVQPRRARS